MSYSITCKHCGQSGFKWERGPYGRFLLIDASGNTHACVSKRQFIANKDAVCPACGEAIHAGITPVTWARRGDNRGVLYHEHCNGNRETPKTEVPVPAIPETKPEKDDTAMSDNLAAMLAAQIRPHLKMQADELSSNLMAHVENRIKTAIAELKPVVHRVAVIDGKETEAVTDYQHKKFEIMLKLALMGKPSWHFGPAGTGKSYAPEVIARMLNRPFYYLACVGQTTKAELFGFIDINGNCVRTQFREAWENGGVFLLDEITLASGNLLGGLNGALMSGKAAFPDKLVSRHKDFVLIATDNTNGQGATAAYVDRRPIDESVRERFVFVSWEIDEELERKVSSTKFAHSDRWVNWVQAIRPTAKSISPKLLVTPRASYSGCELLHQGFKSSDVAEMVVFKGFDETSVRSILSRHPVPVF